MEKNNAKIYYLKDVNDNELINQLKRSKRINNHSLSSNSISFELFQGEIVHYQRLNPHTRLFVNEIAIVLDSSSKEQTNVMICPLQKVNCDQDYLLGIRIGKIFYLGIENEYVAVIPKIQSVAKDFISKDFKLNESYIGGNKAEKIIYAYSNFLQAIIDKRSQIKKGNLC